MPSAGEAGAVAYLEPLARRDEAVAAALRDVLASLERRARRSRRQPFDRLTSPQRVALLEVMEKEEAERFRAARDLVYEAYYTNPLVWRRLGYEFMAPRIPGRRSSRSKRSCCSASTLPRLYRDAP